MTESIRIPISWIKDYIKHINRLDLEYEPNTCDLDDVVKQEMKLMIDEYLEERGGNYDDRQRENDL